MMDLAHLAAALARHGRVARVVVAGVEGSAPREAGAAMLVWAGGQAGTIGGGALEWQAAEVARALLDQTAGEYGEKLSAQGLELILKKPEEPVTVMADGRHLWRILDNLMNNICKYAQPGTRVYLNLEQKNGKAVMQWPNGYLSIQIKSGIILI